MTVTCAMFGKLQTRRDFIAVATPRRFLSTWEQWLQNSVAASRETLKGRWNDIFLTAPIWRFWLGADVCGAATMGAIMPSMDGVGRYFPLTVAAFAEEDSTFAPPEVDAQDGWFEKAEDFLLATLELTDHAEVLRAFEALERPADVAQPQDHPRAVRAISGITAIRVDGVDFPESFALARQVEPQRAFSSSTFWWTTGGEGFPASAFSASQMPTPHAFASMLTGHFEGDPDE